MCALQQTGKPVCVLGVWSRQIACCLHFPATFTKYTACVAVKGQPHPHTRIPTNICEVQAYAYGMLVYKEGQAGHHSTYRLQIRDQDRPWACYIIAGGRASAPALVFWRQWGQGAGGPFQISKSVFQGFKLLHAEAQFSFLSSAGKTHSLQVCQLAMCSIS